MEDRERLEKLRRLAELRARAGGGLPPNPTATTQPDASTRSLDPPIMQRVGGKYSGPGGLKETLKQMGGEMGGSEKLGLGMLQSGERSARALGIPQALRAAGVPLDDTSAIGDVAEGAGPIAAVGDAIGTVGQALPLGMAGARMLPGAVSRFAVRNPKTAAYVGGSLGAAGTTAVMTPGGPEERGIEAAKAAVIAPPVTAALRVASKPLEMSLRGQQIKAATGEMPPVSIGAESKLVTDMGDIIKGIPFAGSGVVAGEERVLDAGVRQLWQHATPPGKPNLLASSGRKVERGVLFQDLQKQFDDTYDSLLKGHRIPVLNQDRAAVTNIVDRNLGPDDAARVHLFLDKYFPKGNHIGGTAWKDLQEKVRFSEGKFKGSQDPTHHDIGEVFEKIDNYLVRLRNKAVPKSVAAGLEATDQAYASRKLLEKAVHSSGADKALTPKMLADALRSRTSEGALARGHGTGQQLIDPLNAALGKLDEPSTGAALWQLRRLIRPGIASAAGGLVGGVPGYMAIPGAAAAANVIGAGPRGAKAMFGQYDSQKALAEFLRRNPSILPSSAAALDVQTQE